MGQFTEAVKWASEAVDKADNDESAGEYADKIAQFEERRPYRTSGENK